MTKKESGKIQSAEIQFLRNILNCILQDRIRNKYIKKKKYWSCDMQWLCDGKTWNLNKVMCMHDGCRLRLCLRVEYVTANPIRDDVLEHSTWLLLYSIMDSCTNRLCALSHTHRQYILLLRFHLQVAVLNRRLLWVRENKI